MVYGYTKTTEYTKFNFRKLHISILTYKKELPYWWYTGIRRLPKHTKFIYKTKKINFNSKKGLPYWWYTGIRRLQSIQDSILENFIYQFSLIKRGFHIDGIRVYEDYQSIQNLFRKLKKSNLNYIKRSPYLMYTGLKKLTKYTKFNFRKLYISILTYKKGLLYWWYTGIQRLQSIQNLFGKLKNQF